MKICYLSYLDSCVDEGGKKNTYYYITHLRKRHNILQINPKANLFKELFLTKILNFRPDIIHIIYRPNINRFVVGKFLKSILRESKVVISAMQPPKNIFLTKLFLPFLKVDLVLAQCHMIESFFRNLGFNTSFLEAGVDLHKFYPVDHITKYNLRKQYGLDLNAFTILHVGPLLKGRNLNSLMVLQEMAGCEVVIVSNAIHDRDLFRDLTAINFKIFSGFYPDIEKFYQLADCYVFPTVNASNAIGIPLSVMEAMACNLPVITTRFQGLPQLFKEGDGLFYVDNIERQKVNNILSSIRKGKLSVNTRSKVLAFSWERVTNRLESLYLELLNQ